MTEDSSQSIGSILREMNIPRPAINEPPADQRQICPICRGAGWLRRDVSVQHSSFGTPVQCMCLIDELERVRLADLRRMSALQGQLNSMTFENFDSRIPGVDNAYQKARRFARDPSGWLVLHGLVGSGKTHLAAAIANVALDNKVKLLFSAVPDLLEHMRAAFSPNSDTRYDELFENVRITNLLILDDLGTESATPWAQEKLYQIINHRYNYRSPTVITTNRHLDKLDDRVASRIQDKSLSQVIEISSGDYRSREKHRRRYR